MKVILVIRLRFDGCLAVVGIVVVALVVRIDERGARNWATGGYGNRGKTRAIRIDTV